ncbi:hypothetical protein A8924_5387 [Saccharopolyspora erythraea NRRL 2338]|uniref:Uncharacterized protein n=2 Tax=Saccharopolyspora erythraea TaxID=1836 RepID=A4FJP3_SACEN|nr:hypothetical protein [Saccharopolyspora erythraea]EQD86088.1 hypothetical protein N599_11535 [Saccharopolyspora erythraea D]PFG97913.1 hypothetical protein A8924_5387 [Saccharopolyspora erythraea NRRL 2338]QRK88048.1 hypothetical protein JQX30_25385 [Saccharopolyspora erythraea]CAM04268.1 hypothetical protein SACE_5004 [Saccharopolyspora erythraea NRRL 2338]
MNTRIFLADMPLLVRGIIETAVRQRPDLIVAGALTHDVNRIVDAIDTARADIVVLETSRSGGAEVLIRLLERRPPKPLLLIGQGGGAMFRCQPLGELSPQALLESVEQL